jgi:protein Tex
MIDIPSHISSELSLAPSLVASALALRADGGTIPFIARYRKEKTGGMTETQLSQLFERFDYLTELQERKRAILQSVAEQGKLTEVLRQQFEACVRKVDLEDLYLPFRPRRRTRASDARDKGLTALAERLRALNVPETATVDLQAEAAPFVAADREVATADAALAGASDILAEDLASETSTHVRLRDIFLQTAILRSSITGDLPEGTTKFETYREYTSPLGQAPSHALLAILRGEAQHVLTVDITVDDAAAAAALEERVLQAPADSLRTYLRTMVHDAYERLIKPSLLVEIRSAAKENADYDSVLTFAGNLRELLLSSPAGSKVTLAIDPGFRTGCKVVVIDGTGKYVASDTIQPHRAAAERTRAAQILTNLIQQHHVELIAIGNGTASRETDRFVTEMLRTVERAPIKVIVNEAGASVYSASKLAVKEFPELDVTLRGAISIGRRLQDPLAEMVKIDPKAIGIGQYQHDIDQKLLRRKLEETVSSCVNFVGVDLNTASRELLRYVSGFNASIADSLVSFRNHHGAFASREGLRQVSKFGPKTFEQAAGFLRIRGGANPLDNTAVHPESYPTAERIIADLQTTIDDLVRTPAMLDGVDVQQYVTAEIGEPTLRDILGELRKPGRDPRDAFVTPTFRDDIKEMKDLKPGMELEGIVTNVANFGAFVDIGVHHDGLVHVSQLADRFVEDPKTVLKVGQIVKVRVLEVNEQQKRISLSMRSTERQHRPPAKKAEGKKERPEGKPRKEPRKESPEPPSPPSKYTIEDLKAKFNSRS